jgi:signal peptidase I
VPDAHVFVLGDNRAPLGSRDSRAFGPVPLANVSGRAALVLWPPLRRDHAGALTWNLRSLAVP